MTATRGTDSDLILVVEDATFRELVRGVLARAAYRTTEAESGEAALEVARGERPAHQIDEIFQKVGV